VKIVRAATLGFCFGVRRAVDLADEAARNAANSSGKVYTFGPLIHNPQVLEDLKRRGVETLDESTLPPNLHGASIIIRAHGLSPQLEAKLRETGAKIIDATCPRVKASQLKAAAFASAFAADGYRLFLAGEEHHAEIAGIRGYAGDAFYAVAGNAAEAKVLAQRLLAQDSGAKTALIGQTTISPEEYMAIGHAITPFFPDLEIAQTICAATKERQDALRQILDKVDAVIIAGGKDSANTRRLLSIAETAGKPCAIAETAEDIPAEFFSLATVGLASGASTPDAGIDNIAGYISKKYALC
jgi:4-hydroxy-3-methylbut-2-enyl diphosphate reductase